MTPPNTLAKLIASFYKKQTAVGRGKDDLVRDLNWVIFSQQLTSCLALSKSQAYFVLPFLRGDYLPHGIKAVMLA